MTGSLLMPAPFISLFPSAGPTITTVVPIGAVTR